MKGSKRSAKGTRSGGHTAAIEHRGTLHAFPIRGDASRTPLIPTLAKLAAATNSPVSVHANTPIDEAIALMLLHDYSQLPVLSGDRTVKGMVSWRSIGKAFAINRQGTEVRDFVEPRPTIRDLSTPLLDAVVDVIRYEVILVRDESKRIVGLVTSTDLSELLKDVAEAFLRIGEIEQHLRRIIAAHFDANELRSAVFEPGKDVSGPNDLTFAEYIRLLQVPEHWARLKVRVAQGPALGRLEMVRNIRNRVMHFGEGEVSAAERKILADTARFFGTLALSIRETP